MAVLTDNYNRIRSKLAFAGIALVAVSKTKTISDILELYELGHRDFGENYVQELVEKQALLPADIRWHFIGHLQSNKVKYIAPFVELIHGVESLKLLREINKQGARNNRKIKCLLQVFIAREETKFGLDVQELNQLLDDFLFAAEFEYVQICGLMGMASFTGDNSQIRQEFRVLKSLFDEVKEKYFYNENQFRILSMGMSADYEIAVEEGATMVRIGSLIFGERNYDLP